MFSTEPNTETSGAVQTPGEALLELFYARAGLRPPVLQQIEGEEMPQPFRSLLVHCCDMTPTLEAFFHQPIGLRVLSRELQDQSYVREVVLQRLDNSKPVEYGAIRICLNHLPPVAARRVLEAQRPFGNILQSEAIPHMSWPQAFFRTESDFHMSAVLFLDTPTVLYGRRNVLVDGKRRLLAEVIEILAPVSQTPGNTNTDGY
jgi:chorismate-pyruvate lyase